MVAGSTGRPGGRGQGGPLNPRSIALLALAIVLFLGSVNLVRWNREQRQERDRNNAAPRPRSPQTPTEEEGDNHEEAMDSTLPFRGGHGHHPAVGSSLRQKETLLQPEEANDHHPRNQARATPLKGDLFTLVSLTYKAPASLEYALTSFYEGGLLALPQLKEVVIYFQAMEERKDRGLVESWFNRFKSHAAQGDEGESGGIDYRRIAPFRVLGSAANYPVAKATILAIRAVTTPYVLYLECDRPVFPFPTLTFNQRRARVKKVIHKTLRTLAGDHAQLVRLQLYAGPDVVEKGKILHSNDPVEAKSARNEQILNPAIYGHDTHRNCQRAPTLQKSECPNAKKKYGPVFNTAYCKHWKKFSSPNLPQSDLCDSFCFLDWMSMYQQQKQAEDGETAPPKASVAHALALDGEEATRQQGEEDPTDPGPSFCLTSENCNWTNQPTMYSTEWWLQAVAAPCEANRAGCLGAPGRGSAVRQEQYFLKNRTAWAKQKYKICLSEGIFFHHEVDNRE